MSDSDKIIGVVSKTYISAKLSPFAVQFTFQISLFNLYLKYLFKKINNMLKNQTKNI